MCLIRINQVRNRPAFNKFKSQGHLVNSGCISFFHSILRHNKGHFFQITPQVDTDANPIVTFKVTGILYFPVLAFMILSILNGFPTKMSLEGGPIFSQTTEFHFGIAGQVLQMKSSFWHVSRALK